MQPRIIQLDEKKLIGYKRSMSLAKNETFQLWSSFGPRIKEVKNRLNSDRFSLQVYGPSYFESFSPMKEFEKWALVEVSDFDQKPEEMLSFILEDGLYAVFDHKASDDVSEKFNYIFRKWIPSSLYGIDTRPHFEVLGENYRKDDPESEEEIWIPIKSKVD